MTAGERLRRRLNATGCFRLTGATTADWETNACAAGLEELQQEIDDLLAGLFPATSSGVQLDFWEARLRTDPIEASDHRRRELLAARAAPISGRAAPEEWRRLLLSAAVDGDLLYGQMAAHSDGLLVYGDPCGELPQEEVGRELDQLLPAHLAWAWSDALTWRSIETYVPSFQAADLKLKRWEFYDALTLAELKNLFK